MQWMRLGHLDVAAVYDGTAYYPVLHPPPNQGFRPPSGSWDEHRSFLTPDGKLQLDMGAFLVRSGQRLILVDAGSGPDHPYFPATGLLSSLDAAGVAPADVTDVVFTHLHLDHIGWASREGRPTFPAATYRCHAADWSHFVPADPAVTAKLQPLAGHFEPWSGDERLAPGVDVAPAPGHTPGSTVIVLSSGGERALLLGDVVHCPAELLDEEWLVLGDVHPELAQRTRNALAREIEGDGAVVAAAHFPGLSFGRVLAGQGRRAWSRLPEPAG